MPDQAPERVLLTGGRGFVGARLHRALSRAEPGWEVHAAGGPHDDDLPLDVTDAAAVADLVQRLRPTAVVHLAAVSAVTAANENPRGAWDVNLGGALNLTDALTRHAPECRLLHVSSAEVYGRSFAPGEALDETALLQPTNPYAASKAAADILVRQCAASGLTAVVARPFNHIGAGQAEAFVVPAFAGQVARIEAGLQPPEIRVGALDDQRDFLDVDDVVDAYLRLLRLRGPAEPGAVYNIASGRSVRIGDILDALLRLSSAAITVTVDPARLRPGGTSTARGDARRLAADTGWSAFTPLEVSLRSILDHERRRIG